MSHTQVTTNRFADYFVTSGLDVESGLEPDQLSGKLEEIRGDWPFDYYLQAKYSRGR